MSEVNETAYPEQSIPRWFAIRTRHDFQAEETLSELCEEVFFPKESIKISGKKSRQKAFIPHVLFIKTSRQRALELEKASRDLVGLHFTFWIYRYPKDNEIQVISDQSIQLLKLLTSETQEKCEVFSKESFKKNDHVRIIEGMFKGYEGYVQRVKKNLHVVVEIEGICMVMLPFIHPDLLEKID